MVVVVITGQQLRRARERRGWKQEQLAQKLDVTLRTIGNWERGKGVPDSHQERVEDIFGPDLAEPGQQGNSLAGYSNLALVSELLRRLDRVTPEMEQPLAAPDEGSGSDGGQPDAKKNTGVPLSTQDEVTLAARTGRSAGKLGRKRADALGEESQDEGGFDPA